MSQRAAATTTSTSSNQPSSTSGEATVLTPASTPSDTSARGPVFIHQARTIQDGNMDEKQKDQQKDQTAAADEEVAQPITAANEPDQDATKKSKTPKKKARCHNSSHKKRKKVTGKGGEKKSRMDDSSDDDSGSEDSSDSDSSSEEDERAKRKAKKHKAVKKAAKERKRRKSAVEDDSDEDSSEESSSEEEVRKGKKFKSAKKAGKDKRRRKSREDSDTSDSDSASSEYSTSEDDAPKRKKKTKKTRKGIESECSEEDDGSPNEDVAALQSQVDALLLKLKAAEKQRKRSTKRRGSTGKSPKGKRKVSKKSGSIEYKRVDQLWDSSIHNYKLKESAEEDETEFAEYAFLVRRCFNWENKYTETVVDIKSKALRAVLAEVMKNCKSVSLEAEEPTIDPNILFLYIEELRTHYKKTLKSKIKAQKKRKSVRKLEQQRTLCKTLVAYLDEDYADIKKTLYPLLEAGNITFDLMWALFKPNEIAVTSCYGVWDEPRCFKVDYATKFQTMQRGEWYCIEGKYLEYDGKGFGYGDFEAEVDAFKGPRKITSLATYPLKYHKDPQGVRKKIIERGAHFVNTEGMHYKFHHGLAFMKKKKQVLKININGRIMIDPSTFRRINPNYPISFIKPKDADDLFSDSDNDNDEGGDGCSCCGDSDDENAVGCQDQLQKQDNDGDPAPKYKYKWSTNNDGDAVYVAVEVDENGDPIRPQRIDQLDNSADLRNKKFTEDELLLTSPVVLGFAFSEKLWLEFSLSGVKDITYNEDAFESLVLPPNQKDIVRALVESHKFNAAKTIDDVVQGKGKGLVAVLHGPPGTGKTLTAEGISELLKCPLYMVSAGELGTDPARLEHELQKILDIAHSWGAVLLLDEADVFLEKREVHDIHRNALVSIFLRLLEYFQGILFLTTNRVDTFDEAFQSRIHLPLRYGDLTAKAKKAVWKMFFETVKKGDAESIADFSDRDLDILSRHQLNGRQIKNAVRTAQALALKEAKILDMEHVKKVLEVSESFERDLKGGTGYLDAMRSYT
ncbi:ATPase family associated with various cellular activities (AAA) [Teratosphaeria destructans]|uniref:ATPase family associated with various cellular activities (AAA) n=1 Tax=Teratosphaeria destructans TaxID=418781 RepID=A0A9W7SP60_9PEZI|nr:ATPase family associated with various cellular activities (AAA) [Teratosphaeria destructans]